MGDARPGGTTLHEAGTLSRLLVELAHLPDEPAASWRVPVVRGSAVGRYVVRREIGRGGFGAVYEALDPELGRLVALKTLRPGRSRGELAHDAIRREAEAIARLDHPEIVTIFDVGTCDAGAYLVMERLQGETLAARLERGAVGGAEALRIAEAVARALAHAHARGVLHRDVKPSNVFLCEDGRVKLLDFGLSHLFGTGGSVAGTPAYMAPEQARGEPIDARADVFSAAVVLAEALLGRRPAGPADLGGVPAPLATLLSVALSPAAAARPASGAAWLEGLAAARRRLERAPALRHAALVAAVGTAVGIAAAVAVPRLRVLSERGPIVVTVADVENDTGDRELDAIAGLLVSALERSPRLEVMTRLRMLDAAERAGLGRPGRVDEVAGRTVALDAGARALLVPAIHRLGAGYGLAVRAIDPARERTLFTVTERAPRKEDLHAIVDLVAARARGALSDRDEAPAPPASGPGIDLRAYEHVFRADRAMVEGVDQALAEQHLRAALAFDPTFPLAHFRLYWLANPAFATAPPGVDAAAHLELALKGIDRLPEKERAMLLVEKAGFEGREGEAAAALDRLVERYPTDEDILFRAAVVSASLQRKRELLERVLALAPTHVAALEELGTLGAVYLGDAVVRRARDLALRAIAVRPSATAWSYVAASEGNLGDVRAALEAVRRGKALGERLPYRAAAEFAHVHALAGDWARAEGELLPFTGGDVPAAARAYALRELGWIQLGQGRLRDVAALAASPELADAPQAWATWSGVLAGDTGAPLDPWRRRSGPWAATRLAFYGDVESAERIVAGWKGPARAEGQELVRDVARALVAWRRGDPERAIAVLAPLAARGAADVPFYLGRIQLEAGRCRDAVATLGDAVNRCWGADFRWVEQLHGLLDLATCQERLGEPDAARATLDRVLAQLARADPEVKALHQARAARARLGPASPIERASAVRQR